MHLYLGASAARNHRIVLLVAEALLRKFELELQLLGQKLKTFNTVMLVLDEFNILNLKVALIACREPIWALGLLDVLIQLLFGKNTTLGAFVRTLEKVLRALALQVVQIVIVAELALRFALLALECDPVENFFHDQGVELCSFVIDLAMWADSVPDLFGSKPLFDAVFAEPFFALQTLLGVENHVVADDACELILVVFLIHQASDVDYLVRDVLY